MSECNLAELQQSNDSFPLLVISGPLSLSCCDRSVFAHFSPCSINSKADFFIFCPFFSSVSAEIGDFDESHCRSHLLNNNYIPDQMPLIDKIMEFHSKHMWVCDLYTTVKIITQGQWVNRHYSPQPWTGNVVTDFVIVPLGCFITQVTHSGKQPLNEWVISQHATHSTLTYSI